MNYSQEDIHDLYDTRNCVLKFCIEYSSDELPDMLQEIDKAIPLLDDYIAEQNSDVDDALTNVGIALEKWDETGTKIQNLFDKGLNRLAMFYDSKFNEGYDEFKGAVCNVLQKLIEKGEQNG